MKKAFFLLFSSAILSFSGEILTLNDALKIAMEKNLKVQMAKDRIEQSYLDKEISLSYFFPRFSSSFSYTYLGDNQPISFSPMFPPMKLTDDNIYTAKFTVTQPIFTGGRIVKGYEMTDEAYQKAKTDYEAELQNLILEVKKAYFGVLKAEKILEVAKKYRELTEKHLKDVKYMFEQGLATKLDILKVEVALKQAEAKITEAENYLKITKANMNFLLNRSPDCEFEVEDILEFKMEMKDYEWWKKTALKERKEIKGMEKVISIYSKKIDIERSSLFPQLSLFFNYDIEKGTQTSMDNWEDSWTAGLMLSYDIWNWGETRNRVKKAVKQKEEMEKQFDLLKDAIELEVKSAYLKLLTARQNVEQRKKQVELAEENLRVAELLYEEGMATTTDVLDAGTSLTEARNGFYSALYDYQVSYAELEKSTGKWGDR